MIPLMSKLPPGKKHRRQPLSIRSFSIKAFMTAIFPVVDKIGRGSLGGDYGAQKTPLMDADVGLNAKHFV
jgi:hypothetical protein